MNFNKILRLARHFEASMVKRADWTYDVKKTVTRTIDETNPTPGDYVPKESEITVKFQEVQGNFKDKIHIWCPYKELGAPAPYEGVMENAILDAVTRLFYDDELGASPYEIVLHWT